MAGEGTRARELFERIRSSPNPLDFLEGFLGQQETEYLEFKGGKVSEKDAKKYWSKALSGFANTEGGVLIWGIDARPAQAVDDPEIRIDTAAGLDPVAKPESFLQRLKDVKLQATSHPVQGIEYEWYPSRTGSQDGFVVCFIPQGKHKPYRAELDGHGRYYQRIGDSFAVIPHTLLGSLFHPRPQPHLCMRIDADRLVPDGIRFRAFVWNTGTATARDPRITIEANWRFKAYACADLVNWVEFPVRQETFRVTCRADVGIHPDEPEVPVLILHVAVPLSDAVSRDSGGAFRITAKAVKFDIGLYAMDAAPIRTQLCFPEGLDERSLRRCSLVTAEEEV